MEYLHLAHVFIFSALLAYIGIWQTNMPDLMYPFLLALGAFITIYHIYKSVFKTDAWINYIHIFWVGPVLMFIGIYKKKTSPKVFEMALMLAFASFGYHAYKLINGFNNKS